MIRWSGRRALLLFVAHTCHTHRSAESYRLRIMENLRASVTEHSMQHAETHMQVKGAIADQLAAVPM